MLLYCSLDNGSVSLNDHSSDLLLNYQTEVSKQALDKKFNERSVAFITALLEEQLKSQLTNRADIALLSAFSSVKIKDSIRWQLPFNLAKEYPGSTGSASGATIHMAFEYDLLSGKIEVLQVHKGVTQDNADALRTMDDIEKGALIVRDLGFFNKQVFKRTFEKEAFFLTRLFPGAVLYECKNGIWQKLDVSSLKKKMLRARLSLMEFEVFLHPEQGSKPVRLIAEQLPEEQIQNRLRKANYEARRKGRNLSDNYIHYASLGLYLTNIPTEKLPLTYVRTLYRIRWQIELRFKAFKSYCKLSAIKKMKQHRIECYIYASLLHILINWQIAINFWKMIWHGQKATMSILKFYKTVEAFKFNQLEAFSHPEKIQRYLTMFFKLARKNLLTESKKNHFAFSKIINISI